jgi:hypothetical protein
LTEPFSAAIALLCSDCRREFIFSSAEQQLYQRKGFREEPRRCRPCRERRKAARIEKLTAGVRGESR